MKDYEISFLVLIYNSILEEVLETIDSILAQEDVLFEIVISDDGSETNNFEKIQNYFLEHNFNDYKLISSKKNCGTVSCFYNGLLKCSGEYVKDISPGDLIFGNHSIRDWIDFVKSQKAVWSFCRCVYFRYDNRVKIPVSVRSSPSNFKLYSSGSDKQIRWNYTVLNDIAVGASMIFQRNSIIPYVEEIYKKIIYAEDNIWRIAMFDGLPFAFFDDYCVLYEYGSGVSTCNNFIWKERLKKDWKTADEIMLNRQQCDNFQRKMQDSIRIYNSKVKVEKIIVKGFLINKIWKILFPSNTPNYFPKK